MTYEDFLTAKIPIALRDGFEPASEPHERLFPHQRDIARWACRGGRRAVFAAFGLGKSAIHLQVAKWICEREPSKKYLIIAPLGVRQEFTRSEGPAMGMETTYCRTNAEVDAASSQVVITNYERVRDGNITITAERFSGAGLDEASVLRSFGSKTYQSFLKLFSAIQYRFVFTATPSPNRYKELIHYGGFLGIMDTGLALTRWFQRDSAKAGNLTLYPAQEKSFWQWLSSWAVFIQKPSDLGYSDEGYDLPPMQIHWHRVAVDHQKAWKMLDSWGQAQLFLDQSSGLRELAEVKRETVALRLEKARSIIEAEDAEKHWLLWHELEAERHLIRKAIPEAKAVYGSQDLDEREELIMQFSRGEYRILATKPVLAGSGCNFQKHCADAIFMGSTYKFNDVIQAVHRVQRFQQSKPVNIHFIFSESEAPVIESLKAKWAQHNMLVERMAGIIREHGLSITDMKLKRTRGCKRVEVQGKMFRAVNNDCVQELGEWPENCVDGIVTSIPFGNQYEYSPSVNDFGHNSSNEEFFRQMEFLVPHLLRVLRPGRVACIHVKDRIRFGNVTALGMPTLDRFSDRTADAFERAGFAFFGRITIDTDVVRENAQTYRLGWTENSKDATGMGVGVPEYVLLCRKLPSDLSRKYADVPVKQDKEKYTRADWQIDAAGLWKSNGNRLPDPELLNSLPHDQLVSLWRGHCDKLGYDWNEHVEICKAVEKNGRLPAAYMLFPPISKHPDIWTDIARMRVLNSEQGKRNEEKHVCPLQLDIVRRLVRRYTNTGEVVLDPFAGIFTVPFVAINEGRMGWGVELSPDYWRCGVGYCEQAENERTAPTLFDFAKMGAEVMSK